MFKYTIALTFIATICKMLFPMNVPKWPSSGSVRIKNLVEKMIWQKNDLANTVEMTS